MDSNKKIPDFMHMLLSEITFEHCVVRFIMAWCSVSIVQIFCAMNMGNNLVASIESQRNINFATEFVGVLVLFAALHFMFVLAENKKLEKLIFLAVTFLYALVSVMENRDLYFAIGMLALMAFVVCYCFRELNLNNLKLSDRKFKIILVITGVVFVAFTAGCSLGRYFLFLTPNYDFGIFSQMFHSMKTTFTMNTTCERDMLMSHMQVHISPVYWLLLPFYAIVSSPATLQFMQAVIIALGLIPLRYICDNHKLTKAETIAVSIIYITYPVMSGGTFYDMHENMFLPVAILCVLLAVEKDSVPGLAASVVLTLSIKEDAAVYVAFIALYIMLYHKKYKQGFIVFAASVIYFMAAVSVLNIAGQGMLTSRFNNMILERDGNVFGMIKTVFISPAYAVTQVLRKENIEFIFQVFAPLLFLSFFSKKWQRFILFGPLILFNLMPDYVYARNISFQYVFGSGTLLLYVMVLNIADFRKDIRKNLIPATAIASILMFVTLNFGQLRYVFNCFDETRTANAATIDEALEIIPQEASVTATSFLCARLSERKELYELYYTDKVTDYVVIDLRSETWYQNRDDDLNRYKNSTDYETVYDDTACVAIFKKKVVIE